MMQESNRTLDNRKLELIQELKESYDSFLDGIIDLMTY